MGRQKRNGSRSRRLQADEVPVIAEPCGQDWEGMAGTARVRHCGVCEKDVHNLAAYSSDEIRTLLRAPGALPCMRISLDADGTPLTTEPLPDAPPPYGWIAAAALGAMLSGGLAVAQSVPATVTQGPPPVAAPVTQAGTATVGQVVELPRPPGTRAGVHGTVLDAQARPVAGAQVRLMRGSRVLASQPTGPDGSFTLPGPAGAYRLTVTGDRVLAQTLPVRIRPNQLTTVAVTMKAGPTAVFVTAGVPAMPPEAHTMGKPAVPKAPKAVAPASNSPSSNFPSSNLPSRSQQ